MRLNTLSVGRAKVQVNFRSDVMQEYWKECCLRFSWPLPSFQGAACLHLCTAAVFAQLPELAGVQTEVHQAYLTLQNWLQCHNTDFSSVQFSRSVMSNSLQPHGLHHARLLCPSPTPGACSNSCSLSQWCHPTILFFVVPFSSCLQSFPASGSFQMNQFFASGGQSIGASASASVLTINTQNWSPLGWTGWITLQSKGLSRVFSNTTVQKHQFFSIQLSL